MQPHITRFLSTPKTTALGGFLFLLPIVLVGILLVYVYRTVTVFCQVVKPWLPFDSPIGLALLFCLAVAAIVAMCFVAGLLAQRAIGRHFTKTIERQLIQVYPKYTIYRDLLAGKLGGHDNGPALLPVLVRKEGVLAIAFEADRVANHVVVYFPGAPDAWNGSVALVAPDRVQRLQVPFADVLAVCERLGRDSNSVWKAAQWDDIAQ